MYEFRLPSGRGITLNALCMEWTYSGIMEGNKLEARPYLLKDLANRAARLLPRGNPLVVIKPPKGELPEWFFVVRFESGPVHDRSGDCGSLLYVSWFMEDTNNSINAIIETILPKIKWEEHAVDIDLF